jgi:hypothetical protein
MKHLRSKNIKILNNKINLERGFCVKAQFSDCLPKEKHI